VSSEPSRIPSTEPIGCLTPSSTLRVDGKDVGTAAESASTVRSWSMVTTPSILT